MTDKPTTTSFSRRTGAALLTGLTVAVVAYLASVLAFFIAGSLPRGTSASEEV